MRKTAKIADTQRLIKHARPKFTTGANQARQGQTTKHRNPAPHCSPGKHHAQRGNEDPWPHPEIANPPHLGQGTRQWGDGGNHRGYAALPNPTETEHKDCINESSGTQRTHNIQITRWKWTPACHHRSWYFRHKATKDLRKLNVANRRMHSFCSSSTTVR